jgi:tetratricopeptide (TPR) repeat protein
MKSISKLKDEARRYEQREEWEKAIAAYLQVLRIADEGETEVELPLYNRLGDLCVRLGKPQEAVRHYEQAADRYAEAGLYNNAIALCNKALRYSPDRLELIRKLGQFSASQGFITDARRYFLDYAERQFNTGKVADALSALEDFANVSDDAEVREMLARQLQAHGRINDAVDELRRAHALRMRDGQTQQAEALRQEIHALDPSATLDAGAAAPSSGARPQAGAELPGLVDIEPDRPHDQPPDVAPADGVEGFQAGARFGEDSGESDSAQLTGFETTGQSDFADIDVGETGGVEGLETTSLDFDAVSPGSPSLQDLGLEPEVTSFDGRAGPGEADVFDLPELDEPAGAFDLPGLDDAESADDLPLLDEPASTPDLPTLDEPRTAADRPARADGIIELPASDDAAAFDLPLLGDDEPADVTDEAAPMPAPEFDDAPPLDPPPPGGGQDFGLGGDLPLDLSSLGSPFDFSTRGDDAVDPPDWATDESAFDVPDLDGDALGLPSWEPEEPARSFDLPSFDTGPEDPAVEEAAAGEVEEPAEDVEPPAAPPGPAAQGPAGPVGPGRHREPAERPAMDIPAIELPTWDTGPGPEDAADAGAPDGETAEPSWVESIANADDDVSPALPTFTYEDDIEAAADDGIADLGDDMAPADAEVDEPQGEIDEDPLDLAAHLAGRARPDALPAEHDVPARAGSDWLDDVADDQAAAALEADVPGDTALDDEAASDAAEAGTASGVGEDSVAIPSVEDTRAAAARATEAVREVADEPWAEPNMPPTAPPATPAATSATPAAPPATPPEPPARSAREEGPPMDQEYVDLGALVAGDPEEENTRFRVRETAPTGDEDRDFAELLSQFKSKVQEHLPPEDATAHYDLGLAFKEMGLIDEAIGEFQIALRAGHMRLKVYEELGQCFLQKEEFNIAEKVLSRALTMKFDDELELLGVYYHLGRAYEALGRRDQARDAYERVLGMDINFGDVTDRLARL